MQAEPLYQRALRIRERTLGFEHLDTAAAMYTLALLRNTQENKDEAKSLYARALAIRERTLGKHHPKTVETRESFITLLHAMGQHEEAAKLEVIQAES